MHVHVCHFFFTRPACSLESVCTHEHVYKCNIFHANLNAVVSLVSSVLIKHGINELVSSELQHPACTAVSSLHFHV